MKPGRLAMNRVRTLFKNGGINLALHAAYLLDAVSIFGFLTVLSVYCTEVLGLSDVRTSQIVGFLTAGVSLGMIMLGAAADYLKIRKALLLGLLLLCIGRLLPALTQGSGIGLLLLGILLIICGYGLFQTSAYSSLQQVTPPQHLTMNYTLLYSLSNLGAFLPGLISPAVRSHYGIRTVLYFYAFITLLAFLLIWFCVTRKAVDRALQNKEQEPEGEAEPEAAETTSAKQTLGEKLRILTADSPIKDRRFVFFLVIIIPIQTLLAYNWLVIPLFITRSFSGFVGNNYELFASLNPLFVFMLTPLTGMLLKKSSTYRVISYGTLIMAVAPFCLALQTSVWMLVLYLFLVTLGEVIWQPRYMQWMAELAPANRVGIYMGLTQLPWFVTKIVSSMYAGWFLMKYVPEGAGAGGNAVAHPELMWLIYGGIALITPIGLLAAGKWMVNRAERNDPAGKKEISF